MRINEIEAMPSTYGSVKRPSHIAPMTPLSDVERQSVEWYRELGHSAINASLRGHDPRWPREDDEDEIPVSTEEAILSLDAVAARYERADKIIVFRGEKDITHANRLRDIPIGESYVDRGFCSTTFDPTRAFYAFVGTSPDPHDMISMFIVPPEVSGSPLSMSHETEDYEAEFLIARNSRYTKIAERIIPLNNPQYRIDHVTLLVWEVSSA